jgi:2-succinyl-5-enolpyruvyl-6-hydroxy-3-cyclohexene-1-carboxylate synthase
MLDFRTPNALWASVLVETLVRLGLQTAVISPGSRSTPLTLALAQHPTIDALPILDERSASFFALGRSRHSGRAVVLVCTSGTAGANYLPAVIEARESQVPLLILTADRPPELRDCASGQTIDQQKLFGTFPNYYGELALPESSEPMLRYLRQAIAAAWHQAHHPYPGPVHLNCPFRDPLAPVVDQALAVDIGPDFFDHLSPTPPLPRSIQNSKFKISPSETLIAQPSLHERVGGASPKDLQNSSIHPSTPFLVPRRSANDFVAPSEPLREQDRHPPKPFGQATPTHPSTQALWAGYANTPIHPSPLGRLRQHTHQHPFTADRGLILAGPAQPTDPLAYCQAVAAIAEALHWPVLAEGLSPLRNYRDILPEPITHYDAILRHAEHRASLPPQQVLQLGSLPTSKELRQWLAMVDPPRWVVAAGDRNRDPLHGSTVIWPGSVEDLARALLSSELPPVSIQAKTYRHQWQTLNQQAQTRLDQAMAATEDLFEGKLAWLLPQVLPPDTAVFIANSTPVRDVEWFWPGNDRHLRPQFSRGANGIDGTLSTALGMAHGRDRNVLITGDLALLHDSNGLLLRPHFRGHLTILLLNNQGGGIFEMLPVADLDPPFEQFFATPQAVDFAPLCAAHGVAYEAIHTWSTLVERLDPLPAQGIRLLELRSDRKRDAQRRQQWLMALAQPSA